MSERLTRKDIKQKDQFVTAVEGTLDYSRHHLKTLGIAVAAVLGVGILVAGVWMYLQHRAKAGSLALDQAVKTFEAPVAAEPPAGEDLSFPTEEARRAKAKELFEKVRDDYSGSNVAQLAGLYLANIAVDEGDTAAAQKLWQDFLKDHDGDMMAMQVRLNLLSLKRSNGDREGVVADLEAMLDNQKVELPKDVILYELGETLEQLSRNGEAVTYYQRIVDEFPQSQYRTQAMQRLQQLGADLPLEAQAG